MAFDWMKYKRLAEKLSANTNSEACLRSASSRAYYSVFNQAKRMLQNEGVTFKKRERDSVHEKVILTLEDSHCRIRNAMAVDLRKLKKLREDADYNAYQPHSIANATQSIYLCEVICYKLDQIKNKTSQ
jgi:uncharacterized protein (UPF0332 family)